MHTHSCVFRHLGVAARATLEEVSSLAGPAEVHERRHVVAQTTCACEDRSRHRRRWMRRLWHQRGRSRSRNGLLRRRRRLQQALHEGVGASGGGFGLHGPRSKLHRVGLREHPATHDRHSLHVHLSACRLLCLCVSITDWNGQERTHASENAPKLVAHLHEDVEEQDRRKDPKCPCQNRRIPPPLLAARPRLSGTALQLQLQSAWPKWSTTPRMR